MIQLNRIHDNGAFVINADLIETIEACPDTTVTLLTKRRFVVAEPVDVVLERIAAWRVRTAGNISGARAGAFGAAVLTADADELHETSAPIQLGHPGHRHHRGNEAA